jgi:hypothetical protein
MRFLLVVSLIIAWRQMCANGRTIRPAQERMRNECYCDRSNMTRTLRGLRSEQFREEEHMTFASIWRRLRGIGLFLACLMSAVPGFATEPMTDHYADGARSGRIFPSACCYVELPDNKRIWEIRKRDFHGCSAIGGPVGVFRLDDGKLWLTGLSKCSGDIPLKEIYPDLSGPLVAEWLTGTFRTVLEPRCWARGQTRYAVTQELVVEKGIVTSVKETPNDLTACEAVPAIAQPGDGPTPAH